MLFFKRIRTWWAQKKGLPKVVERDLSPGQTRDLGVTVTRVQLPSGAELVIVERRVPDPDE